MTAWDSLVLDFPLSLTAQNQPVTQPCSFIFKRPQLWTPHAQPATSPSPGITQEPVVPAAPGTEVPSTTGSDGPHLHSRASSGCLLPKGAPGPPAPSALGPSVQPPALLADSLAGLSHGPCPLSGRLCSQEPTHSRPRCLPPATFVRPSPWKPRLLALPSSCLTVSLLLT